MKIVSWFSCGNNSAVASKLALLNYPDDEVVVARCIIENEHPDNERFHAEVEAWLGIPILKIRSTEFRDCWEVWERRRFISGRFGAPCTGEMKKVPRWNFEREWQPDAQVFGFSVDEATRARRFREQNPEIELYVPLINFGITKPQCAEMIEAAGIKQPIMYEMGFKNNNCIGCAKATSVFYWARTRHYFPEQFSRMAELSRRLGCRLTRIKGQRIFIDEIPDDFDWRRKDRSTIECSLLCAGS